MFAFLKCSTLVTYRNWLSVTVWCVLTTGVTKWFLKLHTYVFKMFLRIFSKWKNMAFYVFWSCCTFPRTMTTTTVMMMMIMMMMNDCYDADIRMPPINLLSSCRWEWPRGTELNNRTFIRSCTRTAVNTSTFIAFGATSATERLIARCRQVAAIHPQRSRYVAAGTQAAQWPKTPTAVGKKT